MTPVRIVLVDDHAMLRDGVRMVLEAQPGFEVVGTADNGYDAIQLIAELRPDIAILDVAMPGLNGLQATREIRNVSPETQVVILSMHEGEEYLREALRAGAAGYVLKRAAAKELVGAIQAVQRGASYLDPALTRTLISDYVRQVERADEAPDSLTERELEVLKLVAEGMTNRQIALKLNISIKTVQTHRANLMDKLNLHDRTEVVRYAIRRGLIQP
ncbi:response regulator [Kallotenue papyrolyticum]|uniref:response regulator n=1 Tax=Kallotenue papyrolyticum TaxID=1325125 RepID=UPI0004785D19|nr:response regulator transcription factor [Kallotenue papyrolyticum]